MSSTNGPRSFVHWMKCKTKWKEAREGFPTIWKSRLVAQRIIVCKCLKHTCGKYPYILQDTSTNYLWNWWSFPNQQVEISSQICNLKSTDVKKDGQNIWQNVRQKHLTRYLSDPVLLVVSLYGRFSKADLLVDKDMLSKIQLEFTSEEQILDDASV